MRSVALALLLGAPPVAAPEAPADRGQVDDDFVGPLATEPSVDLERELRRGEILLTLGLPVEAARAFRRVIMVEPRQLKAHEGLRQAMIAARRHDVLADHVAGLVDLYLAQGDRGRAELRLDELVALEPTHRERARLEGALGRTRVTAEVSKLHLGARLRSLLGIAVLLGIAYLLSADRKRISLGLVGWGLGLQAVFAVVILWTPPGRWLFDGARLVVDRILKFTDDGAGFLFGSLYQGVSAGSTRGPVQYVDGTSGDFVSLGVVFAIHILPTIVFFASLMSVLYHLGALQKVVRGIAWVMQRSLRTSGAESLSAAANIFLGQTEAPLVVRPYLPNMTMSELMAVMVGGFATVSGSVLAAYVRFGIDPGHLLAASVMSAPAALMIAKIIEPEREIPRTLTGAVHDTERTTRNVIDAAAAGASDGLHLALNVGAMLLAFLALVAMLNWGLAQGGALVGVDLSLKTMLSWLFAPIAWCLGADASDLGQVGSLLGTKIALNEFVAYIELGHLKHILSERSFAIATYALCGFANFGSIGIQIGGISALAPERRGDLAKLGLKAMFGGAIASWITACVAGILL